MASLKLRLPGQGNTTLRYMENDGEEVKYDGLLTKAEVADATSRDVRAVTVKLRLMVKEI